MLSGEAVSKQGGQFVNYITPKPLLQCGTLTFTPADDAHIFNASPSNNYGTATILQVDNSPIKHFLLKFDVTSINSQTVTNAKLSLYNVHAASGNPSTDSGSPADAGVLASFGSDTCYEVNSSSKAGLLD